MTESSTSSLDGNGFLAATPSRVRSAVVVDVDDSTVMLTTNAGADSDEYAAFYGVLLEMTSYVFGPWSAKCKQAKTSFLVGDVLDVDVLVVAGLTNPLVTKIHSLKRCTAVTNSMLIRGTGVFTILEKRRGYIRSELFPMDFDFVYNADVCVDFAGLHTTANTVYRSGEVCLFECEINANSPAKKIVTLVRNARETPELLNFALRTCWGILRGESASSAVCFSFLIETENFGNLPIPPWAMIGLEQPNNSLSQKFKCVLAPKRPFDAQSDSELEVIALEKVDRENLANGRSECGQSSSITFSPPQESPEYILPYRGSCSRHSSSHSRDKQCVQMDATVVSAKFFGQAREALDYLAERADPDAFSDFLASNRELMRLAMRDSID